MKFLNTEYLVVLQILVWQTTLTGTNIKAFFDTDTETRETFQ